jgi:hypothetical protein
LTDFLRAQNSAIIANPHVSNTCRCAARIYAHHRKHLRWWKLAFAGMTTSNPDQMAMLQV